MFFLLLNAYQCFKSKYLKLIMCGVRCPVCSVQCAVLCDFFMENPSIDSWSKLEEEVQYLHTMPICNQKEIVKEQFQVVSSESWTKGLRREDNYPCI